MNNNIIYKIIKDMDVTVTHETYNDIYLKIINKCILHKDIVFDASNSQLLFYGIIENILTTFYMKNFFCVKYQITISHAVRKALIELYKTDK